MSHLRFLIASLWFGAAGASAAGAATLAPHFVGPEDEASPFSLDASWLPAGRCAYRPVLQPGGGGALDVTQRVTQRDEICGARPTDFAYRHAWDDRWIGLPVHHTIGLNARYQTSRPLTLQDGDERVRLADAVRQGSVGLYAQSVFRWSPQLRSVFGLRGDAVHYNPETGRDDARSDYLLSPRLSLAFQPDGAWEHYLDVKYGVQDRYARAPSMARDAASLGPGDRGASLVRARGTELGLRGRLLPDVNSTIALWRVDLGNRALFATASGGDWDAMRWEGAQWTNAWSPLRGLAFDVDLALFRAQTEQADLAADGFDRAATAGFTLDTGREWFGGVRMHYLDPAPLLEDNGARGDTSRFVNLRLGYRIDHRTRVTMDLRNLFGHDTGTDYGYEWRAPAGVAPFDLGARIAEPRTVRIGISASY